ncbi:large subunit ribosomal protein L6 [Flexibacter flexilis DSM 6793]|uniref:Large ribosomal subunit protein uL6 n=1 Tax=Flexibacter flexilis DSM 6793 TaxID=927664 RepID=A0A1I1K1F5_9BACT|nr:50S ribosomal protein L6 [Flexibacter flexilis]SFC54331.1 large subunit ribosomal protein L6 [Flexibacter flexilis DSM 6793]
MSRIGKKPIDLPKGVEVSVSASNEVTVKGPKGALSQAVDSDIKVEVEGGQLVLTRPTEQKRHKAMHGLYRSLLGNMVKGVSEGYTIKLELVGVGFKAAMTGANLEMSLGYSHNIVMTLPQEIKAGAVTEKGKNPVVTLEGIDKQLIGQVAAKIRSLRQVEPYKGKGVRFVGEVVRRKAGKTSAK